MIPSRSKYNEWWEGNKPKAVSKYPYRVYTEEWISWNDFLGTDNKWMARIGPWRPLEEACLWAHKLKFENKSQWLEWCREQKEAGTLPDDIPARPDLVYDGWKSWGHWLGNQPVKAIEAKQEAQKFAIYYIIHQTDVPENVFDFGIETGGISVLRERWEREKFDIVKMFWFDSSKSNTIKQAVDALSVPYLGNDRQRIAQNVWEIIWIIQIHLQTVTTQELSAYATK